MGETKTLRVDAATDPYRAASVPVGDDFRLKIVYVAAPDDVAGVRVYTYQPTAGALLPLHEGNFRPPFAQGGPYGFTGLQRVYEPNGFELQYFCAWVKP